LFYRTEKEKFEAVVNGIMQEDNSPRPKASANITNAANP